LPATGKPPPNNSLLTVGPPGSGKGAGLIIPVLSYLDRSVIIIDPKGEAAAVTARKRARMRHRIVMLNPMGMFEKERPYMKSDGYNPLLRLPDAQAPGFDGEAQKLAQALCPIEAQGENKFFDEEAQNVFAGIIMGEVVLARQEKRMPSLKRIRQYLADPDEAYERDPEGKPKPDSESVLVRMLRLGEGVKAVPGIKAKLASLNRSGDSNPVQSVMMTLRSKTAVLDDGYIQANLESPSTFRFSDLRKQKTTVYLIVPPFDTERTAKWLRMLVTSAVRDLMDTPDTGLGPVLFILDEFGNLGVLRDIEEAMAETRAYGLQFWLIVQNFSQLEHTYGRRWESFISSAEVLTSYATNDNFTAKYLSEKAGSRTAIAEGYNMGEGPGGERSGRSYSQVSSPLYRPEELGRLKPWHSLNFIKGEHVFETFAPLYEQDFGAGLDPPPRRI